MQTVERWTFGVVTGLWLLRIAVQLLAGDPAQGWATVTPWSFLVLSLMAILAYVVFATSEALRFVVPIPVVSGMAGAVALVPHAMATGSWWLVVELGRYEANLVLVVLLVHALATRKDNAGATQLEAERLRVLAHHDSLTGLPNRRRLEDVLARQVAAADAHGMVLSVITFDLDHFKDVNDSRGHAVGDLVLQGTAEAVTEVSRSRDTFGRWGGEEFLVVVPGADRDQATRIAERLRRAVAEHAHPGGVRVTASFGVAQHCPGATVGDVLAAADAALYEAKRAGRNGVRTAGGPRLPLQRGPAVEGSAVEGQSVEGQHETPQQA